MTVGRRPGCGVGHSILPGTVAGLALTRAWPRTVPAERGRRPTCLLHGSGGWVHPEFPTFAPFWTAHTRFSPSHDAPMQAPHLAAASRHVPPSLQRVDACG